MSQRATELGSQWSFEGRAMWEDPGLAYVHSSMGEHWVCTHGDLMTCRRLLPSKTNAKRKISASVFRLPSNLTPVPSLCWTLTRNQQKQVPGEFNPAAKKSRATDRDRPVSQQVLCSLYKRQAFPCFLFAEIEHPSHVKLLCGLLYMIDTLCMQLIIIIANIFKLHMAKVVEAVSNPSPAI